MTATQTGGPEYDARIRRAERLAAQHFFASEFLDFYKHVAAFQKSLRAGIVAASGVKSSSTLIAELRAPLDFTVLLPHFRGFLSTIERHAPAALREAAHQMSLLPSDSWISSLEAYWQHGGKYDQQVGAFAQFLARAFLQPYAEFRAAQMPRAPVVMTVRVCPLCGARPLSGVLRVEGDGGKRFLLCSFCSEECWSTTWPRSRSVYGLMKRGIPGYSRTFWAHDLVAGKLDCILGRLAARWGVRRELLQRWTRGRRWG